jgi:hypothetical protein
MSSTTFFSYRLVEFGAEMGVKAGYQEEPDDESDVDEVIHRLLLLVVSNPLILNFYIKLRHAVG